jgi:hypothetical protein
MELEPGSRAVSVGGLKGRRRVSGGVQWVASAARGVAVRGQCLARRRRTHDPRHVDDHVDEDAGHDEGAWRS